MAKTRKEKYCGAKPKTGQYSKSVKDVMEKLDLDPMVAVDKMEFDSYLEEVKARSKAFDTRIDIQKILSDKIRREGRLLVSYETDLNRTEMEIADLEQKQQFHKQVLKDLKAEYLKLDSNSTKGKNLLIQIDKREEAIAKFDAKLKQWFEIRNKLRNSIQRNINSSIQAEQREKIMGLMDKGPFNDEVWEKVNNDV